MRIVQVVTRRQWRGAEVFATQLADRLLERRHRVYLVGLYPASACPPAGSAPSLDLGRPSCGLDPRLAVRLARFLWGWKPDLVQANGSDTLKYCALARLLCLRRWPLVYRNIGLASSWAGHPLRQLLGRLWLTQVDLVASVGEGMARDFALTYGFPAGRIHTIRCAVASGRPAASRAELRELVPELSEQGVWLVHAGSFTPEKDHDFLLWALARVRRVRPQVQCLFFGEGPLRGKTQELARELGLEGAAHFVGVHPQLPRLLGACDLFLLGSRTEGVPGVLAEAAAQGLAAVATDVGGVGEVVEDGKSGRLVAPGHLEDFVAAVLELLDDPERRRQMGQAARRRVEAEFGWPRVLADFESAYARLS